MNRMSSLHPKTKLSSPPPPSSITASLSLSLPRLPAVSHIVAHVSLFSFASVRCSVDVVRGPWLAWPTTQLVVRFIRARADIAARGARLGKRGRVHGDIGMALDSGFKPREAAAVEGSTKNSLVPLYRVVFVFVEFSIRELAGDVEF